MSSPQFYFAYDDDLSLASMARLCPEARYAGVGRALGYEWILSWSGRVGNMRHKDGSSVWGLVYTITESDKDALVTKMGRLHKEVRLDVEH